MSTDCWSVGRTFWLDGTSCDSQPGQPRLAATRGRVEVVERPGLISSPGGFAAQARKNIAQRYVVCLCFICLLRELEPGRASSRLIKAAGFAILTKEPPGLCSPSWCYSDLCSQFSAERSPPELLTVQRLLCPAVLPLQSWPTATQSGLLQAVYREPAWGGQRVRTQIAGYTGSVSDSMCRMTIKFFSTSMQVAYSIAGCCSGLWSRSCRLFLREARKGSPPRQPPANPRPAPSSGLPHTSWQLLQCCLPFAATAKTRQGPRPMGQANIANWELQLVSELQVASVKTATRRSYSRNAHKHPKVHRRQ